jgi:hypothetical protein
VYDSINDIDAGGNQAYATLTGDLVQVWGPYPGGGREVVDQVVRVTGLNLIPDPVGWQGLDGVGNPNTRTAGGWGYTSVPNVTISVKPIIGDTGKYHAVFETPLLEDIPAFGNALVPRRIEQVYITDNGIGYDHTPGVYVFDSADTLLEHEIGTTVGSTGHFSNFTTYISSNGIGYSDSNALVGVPDYYIGSIETTADNTVFYDTAPKVGVTGSGINCVYDCSIFPTGVNIQGIAIDVGVSGYYEIEPISEFGNVGVYSGMNIEIIPSPSDTIADGLAYAIPIMNGSIIKCDHVYGSAAYSSSKVQLPTSGVSVTAQIIPTDNTGSGGELEVDKFHYSWKLNAYVIDSIRIVTSGFWIFSVTVCSS